MTTEKEAYDHIVTLMQVHGLKFQQTARGAEFTHVKLGTCVVSREINLRDYKILVGWCREKGLVA